MEPKCPFCETKVDHYGYRCQKHRYGHNKMKLCAGITVRQRHCKMIVSSGNTFCYFHESNNNPKAYFLPRNDASFSEASSYYEEVAYRNVDLKYRLVKVAVVCSYKVTIVKLVPQFTDVEVKVTHMYPITVTKDTWLSRALSFFRPFFSKPEPSTGVQEMKIGKNIYGYVSIENEDVIVCKFEQDRTVELDYLCSAALKIIGFSTYFDYSQHEVIRSLQLFSR